MESNNVISADTICEESTTEKSRDKYLLQSDTSKNFPVLFSRLKKQSSTPQVLETTT